MRKSLTKIAVLTFLISPLSAQSLWDLTGTHAVQQPISKLNPPDRHEILKRLQIVASDLRAEEITNNGERTFFVQGQGTTLCSPTGNCSFWVFDAKHQILLKGSAQTAKYLPQTHHGRSDVVTTLHGSAFESSITNWQFDGTRYRRIACAWSSRNDSPSPRITRTRCD